MEKRATPVGLTGQTILALIPSIITQLIAFYRIKRFKQGGLIELGTVGIGIGLQFLLGFPWGMIGEISFGIVIPVYYVRKWTKDYNKKLDSEIAGVG